MTELADLIMDREMQARIMAARALAYSERPEAALILRVKIHAGDKQPDVISECFIAILKIAKEKAVPLIAGYLDDPDEERRQSAALALGESRLPQAFEALKTRYQGEFSPSVRRILLLAIATVRSAPSLEFILSILESAKPPLDEDALEALKIYRHDKNTWDQIARIVQEKQSASLTRQFKGIQ